jgi:RNA recognition motif-containing protein
LIVSRCANLELITKGDQNEYLCRKFVVRSHRRGLTAGFESFGQVESATIIKDKYSGESKGFGFVEMPSKAEAQSAIDGLNGKELKGRALNVNEARPRTESRRGRKERRGGRGGGI